MSGHSKWKTIKNAKGIKDSQRASIFTKISKDIATAAQLGGSEDPNFNYLLRVPIEKARAANMSNERIENAIKRGLGLLKDQKVMYSTTYEAYAPNGAALLIDCTTDNPTRTVSEVKTVLGKNDGKFLNAGSISWKFKEIGRIVFDPLRYDNLDEIESKLIDSAPIEDIEIIDDEARKLVYLAVKKENLKQTIDLIMQLFGDIKIEETGVVKIPNEYLHQLDEQLEEFIEKLEEVSDVDKVWSDAE